MTTFAAQDTVPFRRTGIWLTSANGSLVELPSLEPLPTATPPLRRAFNAFVRVLRSLTARVLRHAQHVGAS